MKTTQITCPQCKVVAEKSTGEVRRCRKLGRLQFCGRNCASTYNNLRPGRGKISAEAGRRNFAAMNADPELVAKAHRASQGWKYADLSRYLVAAGVAHVFEFPLIDNDGIVRLFDLAIHEKRLLVEFDADYHFRNGRAYNRIDALKCELALREGWKLHRIQTSASSVIPAGVIAALI